jgi:hypothetical protein
MPIYIMYMCEVAAEYELTICLRGGAPAAAPGPAADSSPAGAVCHMSLVAASGNAE